MRLELQGVQMKRLLAILCASSCCPAVTFAACEKEQAAMTLHATPAQIQSFYDCVTRSGSIGEAQNKNPRPPSNPGGSPLLKPVPPTKDYASPYFRMDGVDPNKNYETYVPPHIDPYRDPHRLDQLNPT